MGSAKEGIAFFLHPSSCLKIYGFELLCRLEADCFESNFVAWDLPCCSLRVLLAWNQWSIFKYHQLPKCCVSFLANWAKDQLQSLLVFYVLVQVFMTHLKFSSVTACYSVLRFLRFWAALFGFDQLSHYCLICQILHL